MAGSTKSGDAPRWASVLVSAVVVLAGGSFLMHQMAREWPTVRAALVDVQLPSLVAAAAAGVLATFVFALCWHGWLGLVGVSVLRRASLRWYLVGQLGKYVPGGVWSVVGPAEMATGGGATRPRAYSAMLLTTCTIYLAAILVGAGLLAVVPGSFPASPRMLWLLCLFPLGLLALHPRFLGWALDRVRRSTNRPFVVAVPRWRDSLGLVALCVPAWISIGATSWLLAEALGARAGAGNVALATLLAWIVGFLVVPAPGGLGVREAVFVVSATSLSPGIAAAVALLARVLFMTVDAALALLFAAIKVGARP